MTTHPLLSAILASPHDDLPRLIYADWLDENSESERAEFIRTQIAKGFQCDNCMGDYAVGQLCPYDNGSLLCPSCDDLQNESGLPASLFGEGKVLYRRGFPEEIQCTMREWCGPIPCNICCRWNLDLIELYGSSHVIRPNKNCFHCKGDGRFAGIAKAVCEAWPVTRVVLVDREPIIDGAAYWYENEHSRHSSSVPKALFDCNRIEMCKLHGSTKQALSALSHAALNYGRRLAGLPELKQG